MTTTMRTINVRDQHNYKRTVLVPDGYAVQEVTVGAFGWGAILRKAGGVVVSFHNGRPSAIRQTGQLLWSTCHQFGKSQRVDRTAQAAFWQHAFGKRVEISF